MESLLDVTCAAAQALSRGCTLLYPTDTIWGIGCDATDENAVERIYAIKRRDHSKSMLVLCSSLDMVECFVAHVNPVVADLLMEDGRPTTVIMPVQKRLLASNLLAADGTIGVRVPRMAFCQRLLTLFGKPVVSTSANFSGCPSPGCYDDIDEQLKAIVDKKIPPEYGEVSGGVASRIVKVSDDGAVTVLRG